MGLVDNIKSDIKKAGTNKGKIMYFREGVKHRVRFLTDMDDGLEVTFHDNFERNINVPCQELFGRDCPHCDEEGIRTRSQYVWSVWDYDAKEVKLLMFPVNNCTPVPMLMAMYETYGNLIDRDYVISVTGKQQNKTFSVVPMDKVKFRNDKAKPLSKRAVLEIIDKAYPLDTDGDEEEDERPVKKRNTNKVKVSKKQADDWEDEEDDEQEEQEVAYESMSAKELYQLCKERKIDAVPKKSSKYYINLLEEYDKAQDDWDDEEDEEIPF